MERLEPVLKQKFWILLGLAIIMTLAGWWMATSAIAKSITERTTAVDNSFKGIPTGDIPNERWAKQLGAINKEQDTSILTTKLAMWKRQREKMTWPEGVIDPGYQEKFDNESRESFRNTYEDEVRRVWKLVNPMNDDEGTGIVKYPLRSVFNLLKQKRWDRAPPSSEVMWEVREDLWLLESLFQAITTVNGGFEIGRGDACIHQIDKLELRGGGDKVSSSSSSSGAAESNLSSSPMGSMGMMGSGAARGSGSGMPGSGTPGSIAAGLTMVSPEFDPADEFGDDGSSTAGGGRGGGGGGLGGGGLGMSSMSSLSMMGGNNASEPAASATPAEKPKRYLKLDSSLPYQQRGFYLSVKMDHRKIPLLLAELTANEKSVWPIEIVRVQMSRLNEDDNVGGKVAGMSGMSGGLNSQQLMMMKRASSMGDLSGIPGAAGLAGAAGVAGAEADETDFTGTESSTGASSASSVKNAEAAKAAFDNTLKDPVMAQVTICGVITLYKTVKEPEEVKPAATSPANPEETAESAEKPGDESKTPLADEMPADSNNQPSEPAADAAASTESADMAEDAPESTDKTDPAEQPNPPEPKPDNDNR